MLVARTAGRNCPLVDWITCRSRLCPRLLVRFAFWPLVFTLLALFELL